jgi:hypothetical protein
MSAEVDQALEQKDTQDNLVSQAETNVDETIEQVILSRPTSAANVDNSQPTQSLPSPKKEEPQVNLVLRPVSEGWNMGEDWEVSRPYTTTMYDLRAFIEAERGISRHRMMLRMKGKVIQPNKEKWTLQRLGLYDGYVIQVEPTMANTWWWNTYDYYYENFLQQIETILDRLPDQGSFLTDLEKLITLPPPLRNKSLRVILRKYPERIHIYTDTTNNTHYVRRTKDLMDIPIFNLAPHTLGSFKHFQSPKPDFDWDSYQDIDDTHFHERFLTAEEEAEEAAAKKREEEEKAKLAAAAAAEAAAAANALANNENQEGKTTNEEDDEDIHEDDLEESTLVGSQEGGETIVDDTVLQQSTIDSFPTESVSTEFASAIPLEMATNIANMESIDESAIVAENNDS